LKQVFAYTEESKPEEENTAKPIKTAPTHRYNLRNQPGAQATPASAGELADDEQEVANVAKVLDETVDPIANVSDSESKKPKAKRAAKKTKAKK
ncbi:hypothetical protein IW136_005719, partial [Coemansia sp. RSA 678]